MPLSKLESRKKIKDSRVILGLRKNCWDWYQSSVEKNYFFGGRDHVAVLHVVVLSARFALNAYRRV